MGKTGQIPHLPDDVQPGAPKQLPIGQSNLMGSVGLGRGFEKLARLNLQRNNRRIYSRILQRPGRRSDMILMKD